MKTKHLLFILLLCAKQMNAQTICYNPAESFEVDINPISICYADFNEDGNIDLATANLSGSISVLSGNGTGQFNPITNFQVGFLPRSICISDFNNDGHTDIATNNTGPGTVSILLGNGTGSFIAGGDFSTGIYNTASRICCADFNNDENSDLAITTGFNFIKIALGDGLGNFSSPTQVTADNNTHAIISNDFNGDGKADLAVTTLNGSSNISILLGNGTGGFGTSNNFQVDDNPESITSGYFNNDTIIDIATANKLNNSQGDVSVLIGNGSGGFASMVNYGVGSNTVPKSICPGDFNGDGKIDLATANILTNNSSNVSILTGNGSGVFNSTINYVVDSFANSITTADLNNDGKLDLAVAVNISNIDTGRVAVLINCNSTGINQLEKTNEKINLYPNPASEFIKIENLQKENLLVEIYSVIGEKVFSKMILSKETLELNALEPGIYFAKFIQADKNYTTAKFEIVK